MISRTLYALKWVKQYARNRLVCVLLTIIISASLICYFNLSMGEEIKASVDVVERLNNADYVYVGVTNHSNYNGDNFYQWVDAGYFYSRKTDDNEWSGKIDAMALKRLTDKEYTVASLVEQCELFVGHAPSDTSEIVLSQNTAQRYGLDVGSTVYFKSLEHTREYTVSGICSDFYGAYEIDPVANCGLILLHDEETVFSSTFIQFFKGNENDTYARTYTKVDDIGRLSAVINAAVKEAYLMTVIFVMLVFIFLNFPIRNYVVRLRNEYCRGRHICLFLATVTVAIMLISFVPAMAISALSDSIFSVGVRAMCYEFVTVTILLFAILAGLFLRRKNG